MESILYFRCASFKDAELLFSWANDRATRENSINPAGFTFESHCKWLTQKLCENDYHILIYTDGNSDFGLVRLECNEGKAYLSYLISPEFRGRGFGLKMLSDLELFALDNLKITQIDAVVIAENKASIKIFNNLNYLETKKSGNILEYSKKLK